MRKLIFLISSTFVRHKWCLSTDTSFNLTTIIVPLFNYIEALVVEIMYFKLYQKGYFGVAFESAEISSLLSAASGVTILDLRLLFSLLDGYYPNS